MIAPLDTSFDFAPEKHWGSAQDTRDAGGLLGNVRDCFVAQNAPRKDVNIGSLLPVVATFMVHNLSWEFPDRFCHSVGQ